MDITGQELVVGSHIYKAMPRKTEEDGLFLTAVATLLRLTDDCRNRMT